MNVLLVLNITPELEEELVDYLLSCEKVGGFTSYPVHGHGEQGRAVAASQPFRNHFRGSGRGSKAVPKRSRATSQGAYELVPQCGAESHCL